MTLPLFLFQSRTRRFSVLDRQFEVPILNLRPLLREADKRRARVQAPGFDGFIDRFRSRQGRITQGFRRAHDALDAQDAVIYAAIDHVDAYGAALADAAAFIGQEARRKLRQLATQGDERRRLTANARLGARGDDILAQDLALVSNHMRHVARTAALCLSRLSRYRRFVDRCNDSLAQHEASLARLRAELVHDEQTWRWRERLENDAGLALWSKHADAICSDIETMLMGLHGDLAGIEQQLHDIPVTFARLIEGDPTTASDSMDQQLPASLPGLGDIPARLDDEDFDNLEAQHIESELILDSSDIGELRARAEGWLATFENSMLETRATPPCASCGAPVSSASLRGRAHLLCSKCRSGHPLAAPAATNPGLEAVRVGELLVARTPVTRESFDLIMGHVPERSPEREDPLLPVTRVTWLEAVTFCNALSRRQGLPEAYRIDGRRVRLKAERGGWRLPTQSEWRFLCITDRDPNWWKQPDPTVWHAGNARGRAHPVGKKKPNPFNLFDTLGNVAEWLWEAPSKGGGPGSHASASTTFSADERLAAGGGFLARPEDLDPDHALSLVIEARDDAVGFRPLRDAPAPVVATPQNATPSKAATATTKAAPKPARRPQKDLATRPKAASGGLAASLFGVIVTAAIAGVIIYHVLGLHDPGADPNAPAVANVPRDPATANATTVANQPPPSPTPEPSPATPAPTVANPSSAAPAAAEPPARARQTRDRSTAQLTRILDARTPKNKGDTLKSLRELAARDPDFPDVHVALGRELARMGRLSEATRALDPLLAIENTSDRDRANELLETIRADRDFRRVTIPAR